MNEEELDQIAKELKVDKYAPKDPMNSESLFGSRHMKNDNNSASSVVDGKDYYKLNPPLEIPTF